MKIIEPGLGSLARLQKEFEDRFFPGFSGVPLEIRLLELASSLASDAGAFATAARQYHRQARGWPWAGEAELRDRLGRILAHLLGHLLVAGQHLETDLLRESLRWTSEGGLEPGATFGSPLVSLY